MNHQKNGRKFMKRFLSVLLAGSMVLGNFTGISSKAAEQKSNRSVQRAGSSNVIYEEGFETFADADTVITENLSKKGGSTDWNGASSGGWLINMASGELLVQPSVGAENAHTGNVSVKITSPAGSEVNRGYLAVGIPQDTADAMEEGAEYKLSVWCKGENAKFPTEIKYTIYEPGTWATIESKATSATATEGQWKLYEISFKMQRKEGKAGLNIYLGLGWQGSNSTGSIYFDDAKLEKVTPAEVEATGITLDAAAEVAKGQSILLSPVLDPLDATTKIEWSSDNTAVAAVDENGKVSGISEGTANITAKAGKVSASCKVTVTDKANLYKVLYKESFETFADAATEIGNTPSTNASKNWNGAKNGDWDMNIAEGSLIVAPSLEDAKDGKVSVKLTSEKASGTNRGEIKRTLPQEVYDSLIDGAKYKITAYFKGLDNAAFPVRITTQVKDWKEASLSGDSLIWYGDYTDFTLKNNEWIKAEHTFTVEKGVGKGCVYLILGIPWHSGNMPGSVLIDHITLERVPYVEDITLDIEESYLEIGKTLELSYSLKPNDCDMKANFVSSDPEVLSVDADGKVTGLKEGTATVTASVAGYDASASCKIKVVEKYVKVESISLNKTALNVTPGWQEQLIASVTPENVTEKNIVWTSSDEKVVKVDQDGNITALSEGTAKITVKADGKSAECSVTVKQDAEFKNQTADVTINPGMKLDTKLPKLPENCEYTFFTEPVKGKITVEENTVYYTAYTWLMEKDGIGYEDKEYTDTIQMSVKNGEVTAIYTVNVTINKLEEMFYDEAGQWIQNVDLMFSEEEIQAVKKEISEQPDGLRAQMFQRLIKQADSMINAAPDAYPDHPDNATESRDESLRDEADNTVTFLMAYLLTKDVSGYETKNAQYLAKTIEFAKASMSYPYWGASIESIYNRNSDLTAGHHLFSVSMVYQWLKEELKNETCTYSIGADGTKNTVTTTENMPMLEAMEAKLWYVGNEMFEHSKGVYYYVMNHCHVRMGGLLAASIALRGDAETNEEKVQLINWTGMVFYKDGMGMNSMMPDGTSQEGVPYWEYAAEWMIRAGLMIRKAYDVDLFETTHVFENSGDYLLYNLLPQDNWTASSCLLNVGDSPTGNWYGPGLHLRFIAAEYGDATAQWLAEQVENAGIDVWSGQWMCIFYADPELEAKEPGKTETLKWFKDMDHVIARSDWSGNEDLLSMKTGVPCGKNLMQLVQEGLYSGDPDAGHAHPDANHITLYSNGEFLLRDDGYSYKYASNHNTLLVNGTGQIGEGDWMNETLYIDNNIVPHIEKAESNESYDYIVGDATEAYAADLGLDLFERNVVFLKDEKVLLVVDNVQAENETDLELRWFPESKAVAHSGNVYIAKGTKNTMNFYPLTTETETAYEDVIVYGQDNVKSNEKTFRQTYHGTSWQNAVAFSWNENEKEAAYVVYKAGDSANVHQFGVNGKIYTINTETKEVTVKDGILDNGAEADNANSTLSGILINNKSLEGFDPAVTEYEVERWWKTYETQVDAYSAAYGAKVQIEQKSPELVEITCTSKDQTATTVYTLHITNPQKILGIAGVETDGKKSENPDYIYDSLITEANPDPRIWACENLPTLIFDLGELVLLEDIDIAFNWSSRRASYFDLLVSEDGENYTYLIEDGEAPITSGTSTPSHSEYLKVVEAAAKTVRYVKIKLRGQSSAGKDNKDAVNSIQEITFIGERLHTTEDQEKVPEKLPETNTSGKPEYYPAGKTDSSTSSASTGTKTGDGNQGTLFVMTAVAALAVVSGLAYKRKKCYTNR